MKAGGEIAENLFNLYDFCRTIDNIADQNTELILKKKELEEFLRKKQYIAKDVFLVAQYNSPWALPPFRKNEILISIE